MSAGSSVFVAWDFSIPHLKISVQSLVPKQSGGDGVWFRNTGPGASDRGTILEALIREIYAADRVLGAMEAPNANVAFEVGLGAGMRKPYRLVQWYRECDSPAKWLRETPLFVELGIPDACQAAQLETLARAGEGWEPPTTPSERPPVEPCVASLCPESGLYGHNCTRLHDQLDLSWSTPEPSQLRLNRLEPVMHGLEHLIWTIATPEAEGARDGVEDTGLAAVAGWFLGRRALQLAEGRDITALDDQWFWYELFGSLHVLRLESARSVVDVKTFESTFPAESLYEEAALEHSYEEQLKTLARTLCRSWGEAKAATSSSVNSGEGPPLGVVRSELGELQVVTFWAAQRTFSHAQAVSNVGAWLARQGKRVLIVDSHLTRSLVAKTLAALVDERFDPDRALPLERHEEEIWKDFVFPVTAAEGLCFLRLSPTQRDDRQALATLHECWQGHFDFVLHHSSDAMDAGSCASLSDVVVLQHHAGEASEWDELVGAFAHVFADIEQRPPVLPLPLLARGTNIARMMREASHMLELTCEWALPDGTAADQMQICCELIHSVALPQIQLSPSETIVVFDADVELQFDVERRQLVSAYRKLGRLLANGLDWRWSDIEEVLQRSLRADVSRDLRKSIQAELRRTLTSEFAREPRAAYEEPDANELHSAFNTFNTDMADTFAVTTERRTKTVPSHREATANIRRVAKELLHVLDIVEHDPNPSEALRNAQGAGQSQKEPQPLIVESDQLALALDGGDGSLASIRKLLAANPGSLEALREIEQVFRTGKETDFTEFEERVGAALAEAESSSDTELARLVVVHEKLGDYHRARGQLDEAVGQYQRALTFLEQRARLSPKNLMLAVQLSNAYERLGDLLSSQGSVVVARSLYERGLKLREVLGQGSSDADVSSLARTHERMADGYLKEGQLEVAAVHYEKARSLLKDATDRDVSWLGLARITRKLGDVERGRQRRNEARYYYEDALSWQTPSSGSSSSRLEVDRERCRTLLRLGDLLKRSEPTRALNHYAEAHALYAALHERTPDDADRCRDLAGACGRLGDLYAAEGSEQATPQYEHALALFETVARHPQARSLDKRARVVALRKLGDHLKRRGDAQRAMQHFSNGVGAAKRLVAEEPNDVKHLRELVVAVMRLVKLGGAEVVTDAAHLALEQMHAHHQAETLPDELEHWMTFMENVIGSRTNPKGMS